MTREQKDQMNAMDLDTKWTFIQSNAEKLNVLVGLHVVPEELSHFIFTHFSDVNRQP